MKFSVLPLVHADHATFPDYPEGGTPRDALTALTRAHGEAYVIDVQGVRRNKPDLEFLREATRNLPVWLDAGSRYATDAMDALVAGASRLTLRWNTLASRGELEELADLGDPGTFLVGLEFDPKGFLANPKDRGESAESLARLATDLGLGIIVQAPAFDPSLARRFAAAGAERWWYGPLRRDEAVEARRLGFTGVVVPAATVRSLADVAGEEAAP